MADTSITIVNYFDTEIFMWCLMYSLYQTPVVIQDVTVFLHMIPPHHRIWYAVKRNSEDFLAAFWNKGRLAFKCICLISFKYNSSGYGFSVQISMFSLSLCTSLLSVILSACVRNNYWNVSQKLLHIYSSTCL